MKKRNKLVFLATVAILFLAQSLLANPILVEGEWRDEYYRSLEAPVPPSVSIEGSILSFDFEDALSDLTICVVDANNVKVYEGMVSMEAGGSYSVSLDGNASGMYQVILVHKFGRLAGEFTLE